MKDKRLAVSICMIKNDSGDKTVIKNALCNINATNIGDHWEEDVREKVTKMYEESWPEFSVYQILFLEM